MINQNVLIDHIIVISLAVGLFSALASQHLIIKSAINFGVSSEIFGLNPLHILTAKF
jgi:hypothetical protein